MLIAIRIQKIIFALKVIYLVIGIACLLLIWMVIIKNRDYLAVLTNPEAREVLIRGGLVGIIYWGLLKKKSWTPKLILYSQALALIWLMMPSSLTISEFVAKVMWALFVLCQFWFFTRTEVQQFFGEKDRALF